MSASEKLDECKKEIRSLLISYQKGCYLAEFQNAYRDFIGKKLPSRDFGFKTDIEFLYSIPDVVRVTLVSRDLYHLQGIADEKSKHIQKMVCKQKPAKLKGPSLPRSRLREYTPTSRYYGPSQRTSRSTSYQSTDDSSNSARKLTETKSVPSSKSLSPKEEVVSLVKSFKDGIALSDLLFEYEKMYNKKFSFEKYGFSSLQECIENISELHLIVISNVTYVVHNLESSRVLANSAVKIHNTQEVLSSTTNLHNHDETSKAVSEDYGRSQNNDTSRLPETIYKKFVKVAKKYSQGILASEFPSCFEEVTNTPFDLHSLGYNSLADCIDEYPDIFRRKHVAGSKKDYIIYPFDEFTSDLKDCVKDNAMLPPVGALLIDHIILNIRRILEAYSEGVKLQEFLHVYSINCKDSLHIQDLGFRDLETFLLSIKDCVPLKIESVCGVKTIHLLKLSDYPVEHSSPSSFVCKEEAIPFDAAFPDIQFKPLTLPSDFDFGKYFPVFVSSVENPGHLYIQLNDDTATDFTEFAAKLNSFYNGESSHLYAMKNAHIKVGASCVALWPTDQQWYRAQILSIPSMDTVQVHYIDYGTRDVIPKSLLRYIKKEYTEFHIEALRCRLAYIKPAKNAPKWDPKSGARILKMCDDTPLMAKIEEDSPDDVYSIVLCDTNGEKDVYINDVLLKEGLAEYITEESTTNILLSQEPSTALSKLDEQTEIPYLYPLQALQAKYFLQAFATVAPSFAKNEHYLKLLQQILMHCPNADAELQSPSLPFNPGLAGPIDGLFHQNINTVPSFNTMHPPSFPTFDINVLNTSPIKRPKANPLLSPVSGADTTADFESEIFEDDDDETFQQFCQQVTSAKLRYVKRVSLGDGYKIHIIVVESKPYASSGDISQLIWNNREADYLYRRLQIKNPDIPAVTLSEDGNEELFHQLDRYNVKGVQKTSGFKAAILLYPLTVVIKILNLFGHPSISLRAKLTEEIASFNPNDEIWKEFSAPEAPEPEEYENAGVTDDDKIEKLCLFDLLAMKEGIKCRRMKILKNLDNSDSASYAEEISKLELLHQKVLQRITEIKDICNLFA